MKKIRDIAGQRFGKTVTIKFIKRENKRTVWQCKCDCGNIHEVQAGALISGNTTSCGCKLHKLGKENPGFKDITGQKFGILIATEYSGSKRGRTMWKCLCECGNTKEISSDSLSSGNSTSCGCKHNRHGNLSPNFRGFQEISGQFWRTLLIGAKVRNIPFDITIEQIWELFLRQNRRCALTNLLLEFNNRSKNYTGTASLDRIDSSKGYTIDNIQWTHKDYNMMKQSKTQQEFIDMCYKVVQNNPRTPEPMTNWAS